MKRILFFIFILLVFFSCSNESIDDNDIVKNKISIENIKGALSGVNLAYNAISCSTDTNYNSSYDGNKAKDNNNTTKWCSTNSTSQHWIKYDLGGLKNISGFIVRHAGSNGELQTMNTKYFQVLFGTSDNSWTSSVTVDNSAQTNITERSYVTQARYVIMNISNCGIDNYARIYEFQIWGSNTVTTDTNLSLSATQFSTDSSYSSSYDGNKAKDGIGNTKWCSTGSSTQHWLKLNLGGIKTITKFVVKHAGSNGESQSMNTKYFQVLFGTIDNSWTSSVTVDNTAQANITERTFSTQAQYVMLNITNSGVDNYARIYEFEVWGPGDTPPSSINIKGAYWLQYDGGYNSYPAGVTPITWNLDYCVMIPSLASGYRGYYLPYNIKTLARINFNLTATDKQNLENLANPAPYLTDRFNDWNNQVQIVYDALNSDFNSLIYAFIFGNEENLTSESGISGTAYARAYNAFKAQWNSRGKYLLAAGPGGCGVGGNGQAFYTNLLAAIGQTDGFAIHAYGYDSFKRYTDMGGFLDQSEAINAKFNPDPQIFITEYNIPFGLTQPQNSTDWTNYFNARYNDVVSFNATHSNQIKGLLYFVDSHDHWIRFGNDTSGNKQWWDYSLRKGSVANDGRRDAWKNAK